MIKAINFRTELKQKRAELKCSALILTFRPYDLLTSKPSELSALRTLSSPTFLPSDFSAFRTFSLPNFQPSDFLAPRPPVGLPGFEPGMTGPESVVLPLHHSPMPLSFLTMQK